MRQAMILAAGLGTRLKPLTDSMPKGLVEVGGKPLIARAVDTMVAAGMERVVVNVYHFASMLTDYLHHHYPEVLISDERHRLLDTGGGIKKAWSMFDRSSPVLIHNVDILSNVSPRSFWDMAAESGADALLLVSKRKTSRRLLFNDDMRLTGWINTVTGETKGRVVTGDFAFSGIHILTPRLINTMSAFPDKFSIIDFYIKQCRRYDIRGVVKPDLRLLDVGKTETLSEAEAFLTRQFPLPTAPAGATN